MDDGTAQRIEAPEATRRSSLLAIVVGLALVGHAALVLSGAVPGSRWVAIVECVAVCAVGLARLRREQDGPDAASAADPARPVASVFPARVATHGEPVERVART